MKNIKYSVNVTGTEADAEVTFSEGITNVQLYALTKHLLDMCYSQEIEGVPNDVRIKIVDKMVSDARKNI
jgi:hypothetical protein